MLTRVHLAHLRTTAFLRCFQGASEPVMQCGSKHGVSLSRATSWSKCAIDSVFTHPVWATFDATIIKPLATHTVVDTGINRSPLRFHARLCGFTNPHHPSHRQWSCRRWCSNCARLQPQRLSTRRSTRPLSSSFPLLPSRRRSRSSLVRPPPLFFFIRAFHSACGRLD